MGRVKELLIIDEDRESSNKTIMYCHICQSKQEFIVSTGSQPSAYRATIGCLGCESRTREE